MLKRFSLRSAKSTEPKPALSDAPVLRLMRCVSAANKFRTANHLGEDMLVVPVIAVKGNIVWTPMGSSGPEFVPSSVLATDPGQWNNRPIVGVHPMDAQGNPISARDPSTIEAAQYGTVYNASFADNDLNMELWLSTARAEAVGQSQIIKDIKAGKSVEVSVGALVVVEAQEGVSPSGVPYTAIYRDMRSDHLAAGLNGAQGACSVSDGCGLQSDTEAVTATTAAARTSQAPISASAPPAAPTLSMRASERPANNGVLVRTLRKALRTAQEMGISDGETRRQLSDKLRNTVLGFDWIPFDGVFSGEGIVVYEVILDDVFKFFQQSFTQTDSGVELGNDAVEVVRVTEFKPVTAIAGLQNSENSETPVETEREATMDKKNKLIAAMIAAKDTDWNEDSRGLLEALSDKQLTSLSIACSCEGEETVISIPITTPTSAIPAKTTTPAVPAVPAVPAEPVAASTVVTDTPSPAAIMQIPADVQAAADAYHALQARARADVVAKIIACEGSAFIKASQLENFDDEDLTRIAQSLKVDEASKGEVPHTGLGTFGAALSFAGQGVPIEDSASKETPPPPDLYAAIRAKNGGSDSGTNAKAPN